MVYDIIVALIILVLAGAVLGGHLWTAAVVWRRLSLRAALLLSAGLSVLSSVVWYYIGLVVFLSVFLNTVPMGAPAPEAAVRTFGLTLRICAYFPQLEKYGLDPCENVLPLLATVLPFFLLSLLPALVVKRKSPQKISIS